MLALYVVPVAIRSDPDAVLVVVVIIWLSCSPGPVRQGEVHSSAVNPLVPLSLIEEVGQPNPSPSLPCQIMEDVQLLLRVDRGHLSSTSLTVQQGVEKVSRGGNEVDAVPPVVRVVVVTARGTAVS